jgi:hypothetical protein
MRRQGRLIDHAIGGGIEAPAPNILSEIQAVTWLIGL